MPAAAFLYGNEPHHLDHIAPLAALLNIPLFVTEPQLLDQARAFYPDTTLQLIDPLHLPFYLQAHYNILFCCMPRPLFEATFFPFHNVRTIWCPHGNSDKGQSAPLMEALRHEELLLVYGDRMRSFLSQKGVFTPSISVGNFRYRYYLQHKAFYDTLVEQHLSNISSNSQLLLYAPTWNDYEHSSSFYEATETLIAHLPSNYRLIVKPHPNLFQQANPKYQEIEEVCVKHPHVNWLPHFPPIYPLLQRITAYIGDYSSIGYDFLTLNRPLFFCHPPTRKKYREKEPLASCGYVLEKGSYHQLYDGIDSHNDLFATKRQLLYAHTFDKNGAWQQIKDLLKE